MKKKRPSTDVNVTAFEILQAVTGEPADQSHNETQDEYHTKKKKPAKPEKNPAAVALGRLGGLKGGKARNEALSKKRKIEIAKMAAKARWKSHAK